PDRFEAKRPAEPVGTADVPDDHTSVRAAGVEPCPVGAEYRIGRSGGVAGESFAKGRCRHVPSRDGPIRSSGSEDLAIPAELERLDRRAHAALHGLRRDPRPCSPASAMLPSACPNAARSPSLETAAAPPSWRLPTM